MGPSLVAHAVDRYRCVTASLERAVIEDGHWVRVVDAGVAVDSDINWGTETSVALRYPLTDEQGKLARGDYRGPATFFTRAGRGVIVLGDPHRDTLLPEYTYKEATAESTRQLDDFQEGLRWGLAGRGRPRGKSPPWLEGFKVGAKEARNSYARPYLLW